MISSTARHNLRVIIAALLSVTVVVSSAAVLLYSIKRPNSNDLTTNNPSLNGENAITDPLDVEKSPISEFNGISVVPKKDILYDNPTMDEVKSRIDNIVKTIAQDGFDMVEITVNHEDGLIFTLDGFTCEYNIFEYLAVAARRNGLKITVAIDISSLAKNYISDSEDIERISNVLSSTPITNYADMLLIKRCYLDLDFIANNVYPNADTDLGINEYSTNLLNETIKKYYFAAAKAKPTMAVGIEIDQSNMPQNALQNTAVWLNDGYADFAVLYNPYSTANDNTSFTTYYETVRNDLGLEYNELHCRLAYDKIGSKEKGWELTDQILSQLQALDTLGVTGFVVGNYSDFVSDKTESRNAVIKYLSNLIESKYVLKELSVSKPEKTTFSTYNKTTLLSGASDPEFALTLNGEPLERSDLGFFSTDLELKDGLNTFVLEHKGVSKTYKITYKRTVIKGISPTTKTTLPSGSVLLVSCVAISGSTVTASLGEGIITLSEEPILDEHGEPTGDYSNYYGKFDLPTVYDENINYGKITFKAVSKYGTETEKSGNITVLKEDRPLPPSSEEESSSGNNSSGNPPSGSTGAPTGGSPWVMPSGGNYINVGTSYIAEVISDTAQTFSYGDSADYSRPTNSYLPKGTVDYCKKSPTVLNNSISLQTLRYGKLLYAKHSGPDDIKVYTGTLPDHQAVGVAGISTGVRHTELTLDVLWKAPFSLELTPQKYINSNFGSNRNFTLKDGATFTYVDITFSYTTLVAGDLTIPENNPIFYKAEWIKNAADYTLRLHLKKTGMLYGWSAKYNDNGQLVFSFLNPAKITAAENAYGYRLDGITVVVDAGHGGNDCGAEGSNEKYTESVLNLTLAKMVKAELEALGATVVMTRDSEVSIENIERKKIIRDIKPDLTLSIHRNASESSSPRGFQAFYFNAFSYNAANAVYKATKNAELYKDSAWTKIEAHKYFFVARTTECATVLTENGFMSNASEYSDLIRNDFNQKCAVAITQGIVDYFVSIQ